MEIQCSNYPHCNANASYICDQCGLLCEQCRQSQAKNDHTDICINENIRTLYYIIVKNEVISEKMSLISLIKEKLYTIVEKEESIAATQKTEIHNQITPNKSTKYSVYLSKFQSIAKDSINAKNAECNKASFMHLLQTLSKIIFNAITNNKIKNYCIAKNIVNVDLKNSNQYKALIPYHPIGVALITKVNQIFPNRISHKTVVKTPIYKVLKNEGDNHLNFDKIKMPQKELDIGEGRIKALITKGTVVSKESLKIVPKKDNDADNMHKEKKKDTSHPQMLLNEINDINQNIAELNVKIEATNKEKECELNISKEYDEQLTQLKEKFTQCEKSIKDMESRPQQVIEYTAEEGDLVDEMLAILLHGRYCPVSFRKFGKGWYMFGTKKIYANILNDELVIRVGGGYMNIDQFLMTYSQPELEKAKQAGLLTNGEKRIRRSSSHATFSPMETAVHIEEQIKERCRLMDSKKQQIEEENSKKK